LKITLDSILVIVVLLKVRGFAIETTSKGDYLTKSNEEKSDFDKQQERLLKIMALIVIPIIVTLAVLKGLAIF